MRRDVEQIGRFEAHTLPNGDVVYYEPDPAHAYYAKIKPNAKSPGGYSYVRSSRLLGVSTVAKQLDGDADPLIHWGARLEREAIASLVEEDMQEGRDLSWLTTPDTIKERLYARDLRWHQQRDKASRRGDNVHERTVLALATGATPSLADLAAHERGYGQAYFAWWEARRPRPIMAEQVTADLAAGVAGRFDLLADVDVDRLDPDNLPPVADLDERESLRVLADAKSREAGVDHQSDHVQLPGYERCNIACGIGRSDARLILILCPDGTFEEVWCAGEEADHAAALVAHMRGKTLRRRRDKSAKAREAAKAGEAVTA